MKRCVVFAGMFVHVVHCFNRSFTRTAMHKPKLVLVEERVFVEEEGRPTSHRARNELGYRFQEGHWAESFRIFREGSNYAHLSTDGDNPAKMSLVSSRIHCLISSGA